MNSESTHLQSVARTILIIGVLLMLSAGGIAYYIFVIAPHDGHNSQDGIAWATILIGIPCIIVTLISLFLIMGGIITLIVDRINTNRLTKELRSYPTEK
jgi:uncharacterized membrane-anchored protein